MEKKTLWILENDEVTKKVNEWDGTISRHEARKMIREEKEKKVK